MGVENSESNQPVVYDASSQFLELGTFEFCNKLRKFKREGVTDMNITIDVAQVSNKGIGLKAVKENAIREGIKVTVTIKGTESERGNIDPNVLASGVRYEVVG